MQLVVRPINASLSRDTETFSRMDPYVVCVVNGQRQKSRVHQEGGKQPKWNDTFIFTITNCTGMNVQVWDQDMVVDDLVGQGYLDLSAYISSPGTSRNQNVVLTYKGKRAGMINMNIQLQGGMGGMGMTGGMGMGNMMGNMMQMNNNGWGDFGMNNGWNQGPMNNNGWGNQSPICNNGWGNMGGGMGYNNGW